MNIEELVNIFKEAYSILDFGSNKFGVRYGDGKKVLITVDDGKEAIMFVNKENKEIEELRKRVAELEVKLSCLSGSVYYYAGHTCDDETLNALLDHLGVEIVRQPEKIVLKKKGKS